MPLEIFECAEFEEVSVGITNLVRDGQIRIDDRVKNRGYFNVSLRDGQVVLRADRHVGLIPLNATAAVRVKARASIRNLSYMIVRSGVAAVAIADFDRGYVPRFESGRDVEKMYLKSLLGGIERVVARGLLRSYSKVENPPPWRGRLLLSETIKQHRARGVRHRQEFEVSALTTAGVENTALKAALMQVERWIATSDPSNADRTRVSQLLVELGSVPTWRKSPQLLISELVRQVRLLPIHLAYYREALWTAFVLLQSKVPYVELDGTVRLDSLIVDVSKVFEAYTRQVLAERVAQRGWRVTDGNLNPTSLFVGDAPYVVKPDIVVLDGAKPLAVFDAKYKPEPKEGDRYELLAFMDALGVDRGAFINPQREGEVSRSIGVTRSGRHLSTLRTDLSAQNLEAEADRLFANVVEVVEGTRHFS